MVRAATSLLDAEGATLELQCALLCLANDFLSHGLSLHRDESVTLRLSCDVVVYDAHDVDLAEAREHVSEVGLLDSLGQAKHVKPPRVMRQFQRARVASATATAGAARGRR